MSVRLEVDTKRRVVITRFEGDFSPAELAGIGRLISSHPDFNPSFSEIVDFSEVGAGDLSSTALQQHMKRESVFSHTSKHIVIAPQAFIFGMARMAQVYAEETRPNFSVVRTMQEAYDVLAQESAV